MVVKGQRRELTSKLNSIKEDNSELFNHLLTAKLKNSVTDYSGRQYNNMTLIQMAAIVRDVSILPGQKGKNPLYDELKRFLL